MENGFLEHPIGNIMVIIENQEVVGVSFVEKIHNKQNSPSPLMVKVIQQIGEYFQGNRRSFTFPFRMKGTDFQIKIWNLLMRIPYGTSMAYVKVALEYGDVKMIRAVAAAIAKNPLLLVVPCHRVIGSDGSMVGYSAGIATKRRLLESEGFPKHFDVN